MQEIRAQAKQFALGCKRILAWTLREKSSVNEARCLFGGRNYGMYSTEVVGTREGEGTTKLLIISIFSFSLKKVIQNMIEKIYSYLSNFTIISIPQTYLDKHISV